MLRNLFAFNIVLMVSIISAVTADSAFAEGDDGVRCVPPAFYIVGQRGEEKSATVELINEGLQAVKILGVHSMSDRFRTELKTIEEGKRFTLTLHVNTNNPSGRFNESIVVATSSSTQPALSIPANLLIKERVHFSPEALDFSAVASDRLQKGKRLSQVLSVYRVSGTGEFSVEAETELKGVALSIEKVEAHRVQLRVDLNASGLQPGTTSGAIVLKTSDPEFPRLEVPLSILVKNPGARADYRDR